MSVFYFIIYCCANLVLFQETLRCAFEYQFRYSPKIFAFPNPEVRLIYTFCLFTNLFLQDDVAWDTAVDGLLDNIQNDEEVFFSILRPGFVPISKRVMGKWECCA